MVSQLIELLDRLSVSGQTYSGRQFNTELLCLQADLIRLDRAVGCNKDEFNCCRAEPRGLIDKRTFDFNYKAEAVKVIVGTGDFDRRRRLVKAQDHS